LKAVILAGGMGTRLREETDYRPKPMVEVGGKPILWHIMKILSTQGINDFVICLGYKGDQIKDYFLNYEYLSNDITVKLGKHDAVIKHSQSIDENWNVTLANTGQTTMTGGRILNIQKYVDGEPFLCTYGDGLADINLKGLLDFHATHGKTATVTAVRPTTRFGAMQIEDDDRVSEFLEKPRGEKWVNGGFFIFQPEIFNFLTPNCILETTPLETLAQKGELSAFRHEGFWQPMDTFRESQELNNLWDRNAAPWKIW
jgi:glucose-1-phosphate cytidylyltransferase